MKRQQRARAELVRRVNVGSRFHQRADPGEVACGTGLLEFQSDGIHIQVQGHVVVGGSADAWLEVVVPVTRPFSASVLAELCRFGNKPKTRRPSRAMTTGAEIATTGHACERRALRRKI